MSAMDVLKEGFEWDPITGEKEVASRELMEAAIAGRIVWDDRGEMMILDDEEDVERRVNLGSCQNGKANPPSSYGT
jgi:hypothetical protein